MNQLQRANIAHTRITGGFWQSREDIVRERMLPFQWKALNDEIPGAEPSHCIENFRIAAGEATGEFYGYVFQDSDLGKWIEEAAYVLTTHPDAALEAQVDDAIALIGRAQQPDGYLNTFFTVKEPDKRWQNLEEWHEMYCAGHLMEAAVAYYEATGKRSLLDIMMRMARHIDGIFGPEPGKKRGYPGHPEIELALMRMYRATGEEFLFRLAKFFIDERGQQPSYFAWEQNTYHAHRWNITPTPTSQAYSQHHKPVREQETIEGHSVRALYLLSGMIDVAAESDDESLMQASRRLFQNAVTRRMYVTGGVGSSHHGESFTLDYDLPNDTVYAETCASIALIFAADRLFRCDPKGVYGDVIERALYNTCLAGASLSGERFFYVNPLEVDPAKSAKDAGKEHVLPERPPWFGCACCPPNLARLLSSLGQYIYATDDERVFVNLYVASASELNVGGHTVRISQETNYPYEGNVRFRLSAGQYRLCLRVPEWSADARILLNGVAQEVSVRDGFAVLSPAAWREGDVVELQLNMRPRRVYANPNVSEDVGLVAVQCGPLVYCAEEADNGKQLHRLYLPKDAELTCGVAGEGILSGIPGLDATGEKVCGNPEALYLSAAPSREPARIHLIPYFAWANRGPGEMRVWLHEC